MPQRMGRRIARRDFALLVGTLCLTVSVSIAICASMGLAALDRSVRQTEVAIDAAVTSYNRYLEALGEQDSAEALSIYLDRDGLLQEHIEKRSVESLEALAFELASFESDSDESGTRVYVIDLDLGIVVGSSGTDVYPGSSMDSRLDLLDRESFEGSEQGLSYGVDDPYAPGGVSSATVQSIADGVVLVEFIDMPQLQGIDMLAQLSQDIEVYFIDCYGHKFAYTTTEYADEIDFNTLLALGGNATRGTVELDHEGQKLICYYHCDNTGYDMSVFVMSDPAAVARNNLTLQLLVVAAILIVAGCLVGYLLTKRIYRPINAILDRLAPQGESVLDEFKLISFALSSMEARITEQSGALDDYHLLRLARGQEGPDDWDWGKDDLVLNDGIPCAACLLRRDDGDDIPAVRTAAHDELLRTGIRHRTCDDMGFVLLVLDATGGETGAVVERLCGALAKKGFKVHAFVGETHAGSAKISKSYADAVTLLGENPGNAGRRVTVCDLPAPSLPPRALSECSDEIVGYVAANYHDPNLTVGFLSARFGISPASISRAFKKAGVGGFLDYLHSLRIAEAERLLSEGHMTVEEVSRAVGYESDLTMTRAFKRYTGRTPGSFRSR